MTQDAAEPSATGALQRALAAEHAAVYGYGAAGPRLAGRLGDDAHAGFEAHRAARDRLAALVAAAGAAPTPAPPGYALTPWPRTAGEALALLAEAELATIAGYTGVLAATGDAALRRFAVGALQAAARRRAAWRLAAGAHPATDPLPGLDEAAAPPGG